MTSLVSEPTLAEDFPKTRDAGLDMATEQSLREVSRKEPSLVYWVLLSSALH